MYVLSFRDLSGRHAQGITAGELLEFPTVGKTTDWRRPESLRDRFLAGEARRVDWGAAAGVFADKRVCFIVHGFNVDRDHGYAGYGAMAQELLGLGPVLNLPPVSGADLVIPILWPGDWYLPAINYPFEMGDVRETGRRFGAFLRGPAAQAESFAFVSHSLGARVVLETITQAVLSGPPPQATFELAILSAPAADQDELDNPRYRAGVKVLERIMVVSSPDDEVLGFAYPAGNIIEAALWRGEKARARALGRHGPKALKPDSPAREKLRWFQIAEGPKDPCLHGDYFPAPWAGAARAWNRQRKAFGQFLHQALGPGFRPAWPPERDLPR